MHKRSHQIHRNLSWPLAAACCIAFASSVYAQADTSAPQVNAAYFVSNQGQAPESVLFTAQTPDITALFERTRVWLGNSRGWIAKELEGPSASFDVVALDALTGRIHYLIGSHPAVNVTPHSRVSYRNVYNGIHMDYKVVGSRLKSEFLVAPHADPSPILVRYPGSELSISTDGALLVTQGDVTLREEPPEAYQMLGQERVAVKATYSVKASGAVGFDLGPYDRKRELVIDPVVSYSTYFGGARADGATAIATDVSGNMYIAGWTESTDLPNAAPQLRGSGVDAFVLKLNAAGALVFLTVFGGYSEDKALGVAVDDTGNIYVTGSTTSPNFPVTIGGSLRGSTDVYVARFTPNGQRSWSLLLGGNQSDTAFGIATDAAGNVYIAGETSSSDFPVVPAGQSVFGGQVDAFAMKLNSSAVVAYSRFLGGSQVDRAKAIAVDSAGQAYVTGRTDSNNFPVVAPIYASNRGGMDAFVTMLDTTGTSLLYSTYLGGVLGSDIFPEEGSSIAVDSAGRAFVAGTTPSSDFPVRNAVQSFYGGGSADAFVVALEPSGQALGFSTFVGGSAIEYGAAITVDRAGGAYFAGYTASPDLPSPLTSYGPGGGFDAFAASVTTTGVMRFLMQIGGSGADAAAGIAASGDSVLVAGASSSVDLPMNNAVQTQNPGGLGAFIVRVSDSRLPQIAPFTPVSLTGTSHVMALQITDPNGWTDIVAAQWRIGSACQVRYLRASNTFQLLNDAGTTYGPSLAPQTNTTIANSQCQLIGADTTVQGAANTLTIQLRITLLPSYGGTHAVLVEGSDATTSTGWQAAGTWAVSTTLGLGFYPITPCRIVDTRAGQSRTGAFGPPHLSAYTMRTLPIPASPCEIPADAQAFSLNMTVVPGGPLDFLSTWPGGLPFPGVSTLNSPAGNILANAAIVPAGTQGAITVLSSQPTDLIVDTNGYFSAPTGGDLVFYRVTPCRVADTRAGQGKSGAFGPPALASYLSRDIPLQGVCGIPASAKAYVVNVTAVPQGRLDFLSIWPTGQPYPGVSTLNSLDGRITANAAIVPVGVNGAITVLAANPTDLILDISGYFAPNNGTTGLRLYPMQPCRIADTRFGQGKTGEFGPPGLGSYTTRAIPVRSSSCNVPTNAQAYSLNITAVPNGRLDFLSVWPSLQPFPGVSTLNSPAGRTIANAAIVPAGIDGSINVLGSNPTDLIIDINGYFAQ